jgi:hypothetical protein
MKNKQNKENFQYSRNENNTSFLKLLKRFKLVVENANFDVFQLLSLEQKKLQIIYANIRV